MGEVKREMPVYQSHKKVWALKIKHIELNARMGGLLSAIITPFEDGYEPFEVDSAYLQKHAPKVGGYYVVYKGGYKSFSPVKDFEDGNTLIVPQKTCYTKCINVSKDICFGCEYGKYYKE